MASLPPIREISRCFIKPEFSEKEEHPIVHLAHWDLFMLPVNYMQKGFLFSNPVTTMDAFFEKLRDSLSATLVHFYSLAGQLETHVDVQQHTTFIFIDCNKGPGVQFIHSAIDVTRSNLLSSTHRRNILYPLFYHNDAINLDGHTLPLLTINVTELVDGVFMALSMNHACADGVSFFHFLNSWSQIFMNNPVISRPPVYEPWFVDQCGPIKFPYTNTDDFVRRAVYLPFEAKTFHFSAESISRLKTKAKSEIPTTKGISSFQALAALVWRCITRARSVPKDEYTHCGFAISDRGRMMPPLSHDHFGNAGQRGMASCRAGDLLLQTLGSVAMMLKEVMESYDEEKAREGIEAWMKSRKILHAASKRRYNVMFSGSPEFEVFGVEFGTGKPLDVVNGGVNMFDGQVFTAAGREEGSVDLEVCLSAECMSALEMDEEFNRDVVLHVSRSAL